MFRAETRPLSPTRAISDASLDVSTATVSAEGKTQTEPLDHMIPPKRRPRFEKIPGVETPADWRDCPANAPPGMRPIYEKIPEAELPADLLDYSAADPVGYRRIKYPPMQSPPAPDMAQKPNGGVRKILSQVRKAVTTIKRKYQMQK